ncbi:MAG: tetratricopeptide repeat protein [Acidobacteriaceae bacterium]|nr:tetratricopeptide repeat protein [Acidobacteriaceae bacterium]
MLWPRLLFFPLFLLLARSAPSATVLVVQFHNNSQFQDLNWVGESVAETLRAEFSNSNQIVLERESLQEGLRRLTLRPDANFTKGTLIRLGQALDADYLCYGNYEATLPAGVTELKGSSVRITAHYIDLRKFHDGPDIEEAGKLADLSRLEEHLAWQSLKYLDPAADLPLDRFLTPQKFIRLDAEESYVRGLLSTNKDQQQKWFSQAVALDPQFTRPAFELGRIYLQRRDYRQAVEWFRRIGPGEPRYAEARFYMGLSAYQLADYNSAVGYFRDVLKQFPMNEVYNNLAGAELQLNMPAAVDDFRHALDGDSGDGTYQFNLGAALLRANSFDEAAKRLKAVLDHNPDDREAQSLLDRANRREQSMAGAKPLAPVRLKLNLEYTAFRQLKAMLQPKGSS